MRMFEPALRQLQQGEWSVFGPTSFLRYLHENDFDSRRVETAAMISVDSIDRLAPELREAGAMVLRLGKAEDGPGTQFALIGTPGRLEDFFLIDEAIFTQPQPEVFQPGLNMRNLLPYYLLPKFTERCMVNLAFASGLIGYALGLDEPWPTAAPATGAGTSTFSFLPYPGAKPLQHVAGQVEIDAIFVGRRGGQDTVFVMESKMGRRGSLAKHKLACAVWALTSKVGSQPVVRVYLRVCHGKGQSDLDLVECQWNRVALTDLTCTRHMPFALNLA